MRKRLIPCIFLKEGMIVRSEDFLTHQVIGNPINQVARFSDWAVDEIVYIDISQNNKYDNRRSDHKVKVPNDKFSLLSDISKNVFVPFTFGGGVRSIQDIAKILQSGADKAVLNTGMYIDDNLLLNAVNIFGSQALVACVDYKDGFVYFKHGKFKSQYTVSQWCVIIQNQGIGEIILNDISRDGKGDGYDIVTIREIVELTTVPVVALGGAGDYFDFGECFNEANPSAVAAGNIFHFKEHSYFYAKKELEREGVDIRIEHIGLKERIDEIK
jgi:imidazole glycerol-phosphate synthase subunit HisF